MQRFWCNFFGRKFLHAWVPKFRLHGLGSPGLGGGVSGPKAQKSEKSLEKVLGPSRPKSLKKVSGRVRKVSKTPFLDRFFETFRTLPETFFRLLGREGPRTFSRLFQTLGLSARRLLLPGRGRSQYMVAIAMSRRV